MPTSVLITMGQAFGEALPEAVRRAGGSVDAVRVGPTEVEVVATFELRSTPQATVRLVQQRLFVELPGPSISVEEW